jgi:hypothetical protein
MTSWPVTETRRHEARVPDQAPQSIGGGGLGCQIHRQGRQAPGCQTELEPRQRNVCQEKRSPAGDRRGL